MRLIISAMILAAVFCATAGANPAPAPTTEFELMAYPPVYPTYSWEPIAGARFYQVQVVNGRGEIVSELVNGESISRVSDWNAYTEAGEYYWHVRAIDANGAPLSDWSEKKYFKVTAYVEIAALGDSITHGGASFIPAGQLGCQWETFCDIPVKNIGRSGDTTAIMIERFDNDVLPFSPRVLLILGGINDIREGVSADKVIANLEILRVKCLANGIKPILATLTPINEGIIRGRGINLTDKDWRAERERVNAWILKHGGIDISMGLADDNGDLRENFTPDGLHPNLRGKVIIGKAIEKFLEANEVVRADG